MSLGVSTAGSARSSRLIVLPASRRTGAVGTAFSRLPGGLSARDAVVAGGATCTSIQAFCRSGATQYPTANCAELWIPSTMAEPGKRESKLALTVVGFPRARLSPRWKISSSQSAAPLSKVEADSTRSASNAILGSAIVVAGSSFLLQAKSMAFFDQTTLPALRSSTLQLSIPRSCAALLWQFHKTSLSAMTPPPVFPATQTSTAPHGCRRFPPAASPHASWLKSRQFAASTACSYQ